MTRDNELKQLRGLALQWEAGIADAGNSFVERVEPLIRHHIRNLSYDRFASRVDRHDLTQIVLQKIAEVAGKNKLAQHVNQSFYAWLRSFVKNTVTREIRNHCAQKRDWRRQTQFEESTTRQFKDQRKSADLKLTVEEIIARLSPEERDLAYQLASGNSQAEIAASMNVHPRTVRRRITELRKPFSECGFEPSVN